jgi:hypothetical protein
MLYRAIILFTAFFLTFAAHSAVAEHGATDTPVTAAHFNAEQATEAYMATLPPAAQAKSNAYFEGGYWLTLWDTVVATTVGCRYSTNSIPCRTARSNKISCRWRGPMAYRRNRSTSTMHPNKPPRWARTACPIVSSHRLITFGWNCTRDLGLRGAGCWSVILRADGESHRRLRCRWYCAGRGQPGNRLTTFGDSGLHQRLPCK